MDAPPMRSRAWAQSRDGTQLATFRWPATGRPRVGAALLVHGLGEHSGRHARKAQLLAAGGLDVDAFDLPGFGASGGRRAWVGDWSDLHADVGERLAAVRSEVPGLPVVLFGHSLGGLVALGAVLESAASPDLLVLSSPGLDDDLPRWLRVAAGLLGRIAPTLTLSNGISGEGLSRDPAVAKAYLADPLCQHRTTVRFAQLGFAAQARTRARLTELRVPTLVIHGSADPIVPPRASEPLAALPNVTRIVYPGLLHELHNEPEHEQVIGDVVAWIRARIDGQSKIASGEREGAESVARPLTRGT